MSLPWSAVGPVMSTRLPSLITFWAAAGAATRATPSARTSRVPITRPTLRLMVSSLRVVRSVRVRPQLPVAADARPDAREPLGLVHQEEDDGEPEHDVARGGDHP